MPSKSERKKDNIVARAVAGSETKWAHLSKPTATDKLLAVTILPFIPHYIRPNQVTLFRFASIPIIAYLLVIEMYASATVLFAISALSDAIDGAIARIRRSITAKGIVLDPLADKLLVGVVTLILVTKYISIELAAIIVFIELTLIASVYLRYQGEVIPAKLVGKIKMILQCIGLGLLLLYAHMNIPTVLNAAQYTLYASVVFAFLSLFVYRSI